MKQEITKYQSKRIEEVEEYLADLSLKRENLQLIQFSVRRFIRDNHVKEMIVQREAKCGELETASQVDTQTGFDCREIVLHPTGKVMFLSLHSAAHTVFSKFKLLGDYRAFGPGKCTEVYPDLLALRVLEINTSMYLHHQI